ncbi:MAG TPA: oligosaccharide flippase family protein [Erysipelothrix sp.]
MIQRLLNNRFVRNVAVVATGTAGAQAITMACAPFITRLYGPEAFGVLGTFTATLDVVTPIAALTYPVAMVLPKKDDDARSIAKLSFLLALCISLIFAAIVLIGEQAIAQLLNLEAIAPYLLLIPLAMFLSSLQQIMQQWLIRKKQFKVSARIAISQSLILNSAKTGMGFVHPAGAVLIVIATLGNALYALQLWLGAKRWSSPAEYIHRPAKALPSWKKMACQYRDFPLYRAPQVTINAFSQSFPVLILAAFFGPATAGFYALARSVISAPAGLLGHSIGNVFFSQIAEAVNKGKNPRPYLYRATLGALGVAFLPFVVLMLWGGSIFSFVFGEQWYTAGTYAQWMSIWILFSLAARPVIATIPVINIQGLFLVTEIIFTILKVLAILVGAILFSSALYAVVFYSLISALFYVVLFFIVFNKSKQKFL